MTDTVTITTRAKASVRRPRNRFTRWLLSLRGLLPLVVFLVLWQLLGDENSFTFPTPNTWFEAIGIMYATGRLLPALGATLIVFLVGLVIATIVGLLGGMAIGSLSWLDRATSPVLDFFRTLPAPVYVPLAALLFGPTLFTGIGVVAVASLWPVLLNTIAGMRSAPAVRFDTARVLGLSRREVVTKIMLPTVAPAAALGVRISLPIALIVALLVDILGAGAGAGRLLLERQSSYDAAAVFGLLLIIGIFGYVMNIGMVWLQRKALRNWSDPALDR